MGLRVGLSGGEVSREDDDYFGDPVVEAARLCAGCESGQILAADVVRAMAGRRSRTSAGRSGSSSLKGLPDPVETVEVLWEPLGGADDGSASRFRAAWPCARGGGGRPGDRSWRRSPTPSSGWPRARGARSCSSRVRPVWARPRWWPRRPGGLRRWGLRAVRALRGGSGHPLPALRRGPRPLRHPRARGPAPRPRRGPRVRAGPAGSGPGQPDPDLPPQGHRRRHRAVPALRGGGGAARHGVARTSPSSLVLDDLQWADKGSLLLLRHLAAAEQAMRVLDARDLSGQRAVSGRCPDRDPGRPAAHSGVSRIELAGLDDTGVVVTHGGRRRAALDDAGWVWPMPSTGRPTATRSS